MTPLRRQMLDAMCQRGFSPRTQQSYIYAARSLAAYFGRSPARLSMQDLQQYFKVLAVERKLSASTCRLHLHSIRFLFQQVLQRSDFDEVALIVPKRPQRIPPLLTRAEVARIIEACDNPKHRMLLEVCYGCGLRVSEVVALRVDDIDCERRLLRVEQGKGAKDSAVIISPLLLDKLRRYWRCSRPRVWLFPHTFQPQHHIGVSSAQRLFGRCRRRAGVSKSVGIHGLRHAYATHQLENGLAVHELQRLLGHGHLQTTLRYIHWTPSDERGTSGHVDLLALLPEVHHA